MIYTHIYIYLLKINISIDTYTFTYQERTNPCFLRIRLDLTLNEGIYQKQPFPVNVGWRKKEKRASEHTAGAELQGFPVNSENVFLKRGGGGQPAEPMTLIWLYRPDVFFKGSP